MTSSAHGVGALMTLGSSLLVLAGDRVAAPARNEAARRVMANARTWVGGYLRRASPCALDDDDVEEVVQHLLTRCSTGSSRFRGTSEGEAHAWCMCVVLNKARDLCRARRRLTRQDPDDDLDVPVQPDLEELAAAEFGRIVETIVQELPRLHRAQDVSGLVRSLRCHLEARLGATIEEQMETYGSSPETSGAGAAEPANRARNRVYQYRARGRAAGCEALAALVAQGRFGPDDVSDTRRLLGCEVAEPRRLKKEQLS